MAFEYPQNLRFKCIKCGICCGDTHERKRHVLLLKEEADIIASTTHQCVTSFAQKIQDTPPYRYEMKKTLEDGKCIFLRENTCLIYSMRPLICRFYPFGLKTTYEDHMVFYYANECPGIGKGKAIKEGAFRKLLRRANKRTVIKHGEEKAEDYISS